jgi:sucrose phosphorylase
MKNKVQLITYVDRLGGGGLAQLKDLLATSGAPLHGLFGGVHLLPFFHPIDGADAGFDPIDHMQVDPRLGDWSDVRALSQGIEVMGDVIVNHVSSGSPQFQDWSQRGDASPYAGMFLTMDAVFPKGAHEAQLLRIYRPRPGLPFTVATLANGDKCVLWTTFTPQQIDIDVQHACGKAYLSGILETFAANGVGSIRLDAVGYAIKKAGTSCFMLPETFDFVAELSGQAKALGIEVLVEVHSHHLKQIELARHVDWVYDFALPPLLLHALIAQDLAPLARWIGMRPTNALNVLDTHDGIGIIDVGADSQDRAALPGLIEPAALDRLVEAMHHNSGEQSRKATGAAASNLDLYQVNCTYYDALGRDDRAYLIARAVQCFLPGVPQIYYVGLLAGENDMELLARTGVGRDINRHHYSMQEIQRATHKPVVQDLFDLIRLRNTHPAFAGDFACMLEGNEGMALSWRHGASWVRLRTDVRSRALRIDADEGQGERMLPLRCFESSPTATVVTSA